MAESGKLWACSCSLWRNSALHICRTALLCRTLIDADWCPYSHAIVLRSAKAMLMMAVIICLFAVTGIVPGFTCALLSQQPNAVVAALMGSGHVAKESLTARLPASCRSSSASWLTNHIKTEPHARFHLQQHTSTHHPIFPTSLLTSRVNLTSSHSFCMFNTIYIHHRQVKVFLVIEQSPSSSSCLTYTRSQTHLAGAAPTFSTPNNRVPPPTYSCFN